MSFYFVHSTERPHVQCCEAGSDVQHFSEEITTLYIKTRNAANWLHTLTQLSGDSTPRFNTSITRSNFNPLTFLRINLNTPFLLFLRPAASCFLSFLKAVLYLLHFKFSQRCFWGVMASWMEVFVDSFLRVKTERKGGMKVKHKMDVFIISDNSHY
jgi:hypothetical protein